MSEEIEAVDVEYNEKYNKTIRDRHNKFVKELKLVFFTGAVWGIVALSTIFYFINGNYFLSIICAIFTVLLAPNRSILDKKVEKNLIKK